MSTTLTPAPVKPIPSPAARTLTGARAVGADDKRTLRFIGTDETPDRYNTIFKVDGWDFTNYRKNPVFLFHHNHDGAVNSLPIGRTVNIELVEETAGDGRRYRAWAFDVQFASKDLNPFADVVYRMYKEGYMNAVSVGFTVLQRREIADEAEAKSHGFKYGRYAEIFERIELNELSAVPVPGNPNAIITGMRAMLPEAVRDVLPLEPDVEEQEVMDEKWLGDRLRLVREVLMADPVAADPVVITQTAPLPERVVDSGVITTDSTGVIGGTNPVIDFVAPVVASSPEALPQEDYRKLFVDALAEQRKLFEELTREMRSLRATVESRVGPKSEPSEVDPKPAPVVREDKDESRAQAVDPLEAVLMENLDALRSCSAAWRK